jgi:uncharacterized protein YbjT (DUF2867 family)/uncharacterized protein YndB with AHSA1/START domain
VLVFGARGYVGTNLVARLLREGALIRATARKTEQLHARGWKAVEIVQADALVPASLPAALRGVDTAYYLAQAMGANDSVGTLDVHSAQNFARAAADAGVRCIIYPSRLIPADTDSPQLLARRAVGNELRKGPVPVIELRAGLIIGPASGAFEILRDLVLKLPVMVTPHWVHRKSTPIALDNLLEYLVLLPRVPEALGRTFDVGGPETLTYAEMMRSMAVILGRRPSVIFHAPVETPRLSARWLWLVTAVPISVADALISGLTHDLVADDAAIRRLVPQHLMTFEESVRAVLKAQDRHQVHARWTEGIYPTRSLRGEHAYYPKRAHGSTVTSASPETVWAVVKRIGGKNRYYGADLLWWLRETADWMLGGRGRHRGRRDPDELRVGDHVDSWTVVGVEPGRRLTMMMGMGNMGSGVLELDLEPQDGGGTRVTATAYWQPAGPSGLLYWWALFPAHLFIFDNMTRNICRLAEKRETLAAA